MTNSFTKKIDDLFQNGFDLHQKGDLQRASYLYEQILSQQSTHLGAQAMLGTIYVQKNKNEKGIKLLESSLKRDDKQFWAWNALGVGYINLGDYKESIICFKKAIKLNPDYVDAYFNIGKSERFLGNFENSIKYYSKCLDINNSYADAYCSRGTVYLEDLNEAEKALEDFKRYLSLEPNTSRGFFNLGNVFKVLKRYEEAIESFRQSLALDSKCYLAYLKMGLILNELGLFREAIESYDLAIKLKYDYAEAYNNRGVALNSLGLHEEAIESYDLAIKLKYDYAEAYNNRGVALNSLGLHEEAIESYDLAIKLKYDYAEAYNNRGVALNSLGLHEEAIESYDLAIKFKDDYIEAYWNLSLLQISLENFSEGWKLYSNRWKRNSSIFKLVDSSKPLFNQSLESSNLYIWAEQGVGDQIFFGGLLNEAKKLSKNLIVSLDEKLVSLFKRSMPEIQFISSSKKIDEALYDSHIPIGNLANILRNHREDFIAVNKQYLFAEKSLTKQIKKDLNNKELVCGISWKSVNKTTGRFRSIELKQLVEIFDGTDYEILNLQYGDVVSELNEVKSKNISSTSIDNFKDIDALASLIEACDIVVTIDNTTAHLAGALGKKTFVLLPFDSDFRWGKKKINKLMVSNSKII